MIGLLKEAANAYFDWHIQLEELDRLNVSYIEPKLVLSLDEQNALTRARWAEAVWKQRANSLIDVYDSFFVTKFVEHLNSILHASVVYGESC
jgi:hypothetical protein